MPEKVYAGTAVSVNGEGFFEDPAQWHEEMVPELAREAGIEVLTQEHWQVVKHMIDKVSIIVSKGSLEGVYPGLITANGARAEGIDANLFFTFFGLDAIHKIRQRRIKVATVGNPGLHLATWAGAVPGMSALMTRYLDRKRRRSTSRRSRSSSR